MGKYVSLKEIIPGMILAEPVVNRYGQVVLAAGIELESHHIGRLKTWGVTLISVDAEGDEVSGCNQQVLDRAREQVEERLTWAPRNQLEKDMYNAAVEVAAIQMMKSSEGDR